MIKKENVFVLVLGLSGVVFSGCSDEVTTNKAGEHDVSVNSSPAAAAPLDNLGSTGSASTMLEQGKSSFRFQGREYELGMTPAQFNEFYPADVRSFNIVLKRHAVDVLAKIKEFSGVSDVKFSQLSDERVMVLYAWGDNKSAYEMDLKGVDEADVAVVMLDSFLNHIISNVIGLEGHKETESALAKVDAHHQIHQVYVDISSKPIYIDGKFNPEVVSGKTEAFKLGRLLRDEEDSKVMLQFQLMYYEVKISMAQLRTYADPNKDYFDLPFDETENAEFDTRREVGFKYQNSDLIPGIISRYYMLASAK